MRGKSGSDSRASTPPDPSIPYLFPQHPSEASRLDLQHYALREAVGANYLAPIGTPGRILDVGTGSGQWAFDLCREFPEASVFGVDRAPSKPSPARNYWLVRADAVAGLPFLDNTFDFVHQRLLRAGIPAAAWEAEIAGLVRITRPGAWIEMVEVGNVPEPAGADTHELFNYMYQLSRRRGLDDDGRIVLHQADHLRSAGLEEVESRRVEIPVGEWGGREGAFLATDLRAMFSRLGPIIEQQLAVPADHTDQLIRGMLVDCERQHSICPFFFSWGRKPLLA